MATNPVLVPIVAANITKWIAWGPCFVNSIFGMNNQGTTLYIQLHQVPPKADGTLANGTVPIVKSLQVLANLPFMFSLNLPLQECFLAVSTTEASYTAVGVAGGLDGTVNVSSDFFCNGTEVVVGDLTSVIALSSQQVWSQAAGLAQPYRLLRVTAVEQLGVARYLEIQSTDTTQGKPVLGGWLPLAASATADFNFGTEGLDVQSQSSTGVLTRGCTIFAQLASGVVDLSAIACRSIYR